MKNPTKENIVLIIPTKERLQKVRKLISTVALQTIDPIRIILVDGGTSAKKVVNEFENCVDIQYLQSPIAGQIQQRNLGIAHLRDSDHLVGFIDDDMELAPDSIEHILSLWNSVDPEPAGIGFNLVNDSSYGGRFYKKLFLLDNEIPGKVLLSGANTSIGNIRKNAKTQWLGGGYTIWRKDVILAHPHLPVKTKWAIGEDLRFSYPIGKKYPLWVCANARAKHNHVYNDADLMRFASYRGNKISMSSLFFVRSHKELSMLACYWMLTGLCLGRIIRAIREKKRYLFLEAAGMAAGILKSIAKGADREFLLSQMEN